MQIKEILPTENISCLAKNHFMALTPQFIRLYPHIKLLMILNMYFF